MSSRETAVILARGESRRMGFPKGLYRRAPGAPTLLELVARLYRERGWPVAVVTHPEGEAAYRPVAARLVDDWVVQPAGAGTAVTCLAAASLGTTGRRFWFHPVDLPDVRPATLDRLAAAASDRPGTVIVPVYEGTRGHPVVVPGTLLSTAAGQAPPGSMARFMARQGWPVQRLPVPDRGCVADVDGPRAD